MTEPRDKPRIFVGSSAEGGGIALALQHSLRSAADCTVWSQGLFELGKTTMESLHVFLEEFDFAVFIITPDDKIEIRGVEYSAGRDNVIFEIGLFMGALGRDRVMIVADTNVLDLRLPSDLNGITCAAYAQHPSGISAAVGPASFEITQHIKSKISSPSFGRRYRSSYAGAICFRFDNSKIEYLLVRSTEDRKIFPKGSILRRESSVDVAAARIADREGGVRGRILDGKIYHVKYFKEAQSTVHRIDTCIMEVTQSLTPAAQFREPAWYELREAVTAITTRRDYQTGFELARLMEWADENIRQYIPRRRKEKTPRKGRQQKKKNG